MKINKQRLSDQIYDILKEMIANYRFDPGTRINVEQIAKEVGASRTPVWEAVHRLMQEGLLVNIPNRGVFMTVLTPEVAIELYAVREVLEGLAGRLAAINTDEKLIKKLNKCLEEQRKVIEKEDLVGYSRVDYNFHSMIYQASGNRILQEMLETTKNRMRGIGVHIELILERLYKDHEQIVEALKEHDPDKAEEAFRNHNRQMIRQIMDSSESGTWFAIDGQKPGPTKAEKALNGNQDENRTRGNNDEGRLS